MGLFFAGAAVAGPIQITGARPYTVDTHSAVIEWQTDVPSNGRIDYGEGLNDANRVALSIDIDTLHRTLLFGLREGEEHVFRVFASDTEGIQVRTNWLSFRTLGVPAPKVVRVQINRLTWTGADVEWVSNIPVKGLFECGYDTAYGYSKKEAAFGTNHKVILDQFSSRRTIYYRMTAADRRGKQIAPYPATFQTAEHNIALGGAVTGTFFHNPERPFVTDSPPILDRVTDGITSYFNGMATSGDPAADTQWVQVDLGSIKDVSEIVTIWRKLAYPRKFTLKGSLDGERWYTFGDTFSAESGNSGVSQTGDPLQIHTAPIGQYALQFIRLEIPQGAPYYKKFENYRFVQLFELKAYPPEQGDAFLRSLNKKK